MSKKLKILQIASNYLPELNGVSKVVSSISERLVNKGHEVTVITKKQKEKRPEFINGVKIVEFNITGNHFIGMHGEINKYRNFIKNSNCDIQHNHTAINWPFDSIIDLFGKLRQKTVFTPHGLQSRINSNEYLNLLETTFKKINVITCLSESFDEKLFCESRGLKNYIVIPNGVDMEEFSLQRNELNQCGPKTICNISNHNPLKGHNDFIKLANMNPEFRFIQVGNYHYAEKYNLGKLGIKGGCYYSCLYKSLYNKNIDFFISQTRKETLSHLINSDIFVMTSNWEASPLVILEAMAACKPWIAYDVGNIKDHKGGIIVKDINEMSFQINNILKDSNYYKHLSLEGYNYVHAKHNWDKITDQYESLYYNIINEKIFK